MKEKKALIESVTAKELAYLLESKLGVVIRPETWPEERVNISESILIDSPDLTMTIADFSEAVVAPICEAFLPKLKESQHITTCVRLFDNGNLEFGVIVKAD